MVAGQERAVWNLALSIQARDFEFADPEVARLKAAIQTWDSYGANAGRRWLEPLVDSFGPRHVEGRWPETQGRLHPGLSARTVRKAAPIWPSIDILRSCLLMSLAMLAMGG